MRLSTCRLESVLGLKGARAFAFCLPTNKVITNLNLAKNQLDEVALREILTGISENGNIIELDLSYNHFSLSNSQLLAELLDEQAPPVLKINVLKLNHCGLENAHVNHLCSSLSSKNQSLAELEIGANRIGDAGALAIGEMLENNVTLTRIDMTWNNFKGPGAAGLAAGLRLNAQLQALNLSWNGLDNEGGIYFGEMLKVNCTLRELNLSNCRLGPDACLVLSTGVTMNASLEVLKLSNNPCGQDGGRHLMHMLQTNDALSRLTLDGCSFVSSKYGGKGAAEFNRFDADGPYSLDLSSLTDKALATQLCLLEEELPGSAKEVRYNGKRLSDDGGLPLEQLNWPANIPPKGILTLKYIGMYNTGVAKDQKEIEDEDLENLVTQLQSNHISDREKMTLLTMFSSSYYFLAEHARQMLSAINDPQERLSGATVLFFRVLDAQNTDQMLPQNELLQLREMLGVHAYFRATNPTGCFNLNLQVQTDRLVAQRLVESALYEGGARSWRNVTFDGTKLYTKMGAPSEWVRGVPQKGMLCLDYTASKVPNPKVDKPVTSEQLHGILKEFVLNPVTGRIGGVESVQRLRDISVQFFVSADQVCSIIKRFPMSDEKVEVAIMLTRRIIDQENLWKVVYCLRSYEQVAYKARLGWNVVYHPDHTSGKYILDLKDYEQRQIAQQLVSYAVKDKSKPCWHNLRMDGRKVAMPIENAQMWMVLSMNYEANNTVLEMDIAGPDIWWLLEIDQPNDRRARDVALNRLHARKTFKRILFTHPYWMKYSTAKKPKGNERNEEKGSIWAAAKTTALKASESSTKRSSIVEAIQNAIEAESTGTSFEDMRAKAGDLDREGLGFLNGENK
ncbi:hypothetical protein CYMTET_24366, partial [Cymbomonas tetramitiformis]